MSWQEHGTSCSPATGFGQEFHLPRALFLLGCQLTPTPGRCWLNSGPFQGGRYCCSSCGQQSWALLESRSSEQCRYFNTLPLSTFPMSPASSHSSPKLYRELISLPCSGLRFLVSPLKFCTSYCFVHLHNLSSNLCFGRISPLVGCSALCQGCSFWGCQSEHCP